MTICKQPKHPKVYSTHRQRYICPFCNEEASTAYNIAKEEGITLYDYQQEILQEDGHRVMVGARQVGKTTTAILEAAERSREGKVLHLGNYNIQSHSNLSNYVNHQNTVVAENIDDVDVTGFDYLVLDEPTHLAGKEGILRCHHWVLDNFDSSLICGTPSESQYKFLERIFEDRRFKTWQIPMKECPSLPPSDIGYMRQSLSPKVEKMEIEGEFVT